jgi:hypothetical protein
MSRTKITNPAENSNNAALLAELVCEVLACDAALARARQKLQDACGGRPVILCRPRQLPEVVS